MKIRIIVPKPGGKWKVSFDGKNPYSRNSAHVLYRFIERKLRASSEAVGERKTHVYVDYCRLGQFHNDGVYESLAEALYMLACFLEDFLPAVTKRRLEKQYFKQIEEVVT